MQDAPTVQKRWSHRFIKNLLAITLLTLGTLGTYVQATYALGFDLQAARCLPWVAYWIKKDSDPGIVRGQIYALKFPDDVQLSNRTLLKLAAGLPGDSVRFDAKGVWINGAYWGPMHPYQVDKLVAAGKTPFTSFVIPNGKLLMLGTLPQSYDGRYVGLVDKTAIEGRASPLW